MKLLLTNNSSDYSKSIPERGKKLIRDADTVIRL